MSTEQNQDGIVDENNEESEAGNVVTLKREEYDKLNETLGSLKRELKDVKKERVEEPSSKKETKSDEELLKRLDTMALKIAGITADDEVELYSKWKGETGREAENIIGNKIFLSELADLRTTKANAAATDIKGGEQVSGEKGTPEYWIGRATKDSKGELMFPEELPNDYKLRAAIFEKLAADSKENKRFYNS